MKMLMLYPCAEMGTLNQTFVEIRMHLTAWPLLIKWYMLTLALFNLLQEWTTAWIMVAPTSVLQLPTVSVPASVQLILKCLQTDWLVAVSPHQLPITMTCQHCHLINQLTQMIIRPTLQLTKIVIMFPAAVLTSHHHYYGSSSWVCL